MWTSLCARLFQWKHKMMCALALTILKVHILNISTDWVNPQKKFQIITSYLLSGRSPQTSSPTEPPAPTSLAGPPTGRRRDHHLSTLSGGCCPPHGHPWSCPSFAREVRLKSWGKNKIPWINYGLEFFEEKGVKGILNCIFPS